MLATAGGHYLHGHIHESKEYLDAGGQFVVHQIGGLGKEDAGNIGVVAVDHNAVVYRATDSGAPWPSATTVPVDHFVRGRQEPGTTAVRHGRSPVFVLGCKARKDNPVRALVFAAAAPDAVEVLVDDAKAGAMKSRIR